MHTQLMMTPNHPRKQNCCQHGRVSGVSSSERKIGNDREVRRTPNLFLVELLSCVPRGAVGCVGRMGAAGGVTDCIHWAGCCSEQGRLLGVCRGGSWILLVVMKRGWAERKCSSQGCVQGLWWGSLGKHRQGDAGMQHPVTPIPTLIPHGGEDPPPIPPRCFPFAPQPSPWGGADREVEQSQELELPALLPLWAGCN